VSLFVVANALWAFEQPDPGADAPVLVAFYDDLSTSIVVGGLLSLVSIAIFAVFASALRSLLDGLERHGLLANLAFAGALLGLAPGIGAETINMAAALRAEDAELSETLAEALFDISYVLGSYGVAPGFGLLALAIGAAALRTRALLPRWLAVTAVVLGILLITPLGPFALGESTVVPAGAIVLVLGVRLLRRPAIR
jgi:hypothetical protein